MAPPGESYVNFTVWLQVICLLLTATAWFLIKTLDLWRYAILSKHLHTGDMKRGKTPLFLQLYHPTHVERKPLFHVTGALAAVTNLSVIPRDLM